MSTAQRGSAAGRRAFTVFVGIGTIATLALAGCAGGGEPSEDGDVTLKLSTFGEPGNIQELADQYEDENPGVTIEVATTASSEDARTNLLTKLAAGTGLADVEQLEVSWIGDLTQYSDAFVPVTDDGFGDWAIVQAEPVTKDGKMWAYGLGTGPEAICYRADMLEAAGLPSDPESVAGIVGGSWDEFFAAGEQYAAGGGTGAWYDSSYLIYWAQIEQLEYPYEDEDDKIVVDNPEVEAIFKNTLERADVLSAQLSPFSTDWNVGMGNGAFATITCPSWMLAMIQGNASEATDWRVANAFPGGGGNIGGSYLSVPTQGKNHEAASKFASWLSAPEQQIAAFQAGAGFPSRSDALENENLTSVTNEFFGEAEVGQIFADRAKAIETVSHKGPQFLAIDTAAFNAMTRVETGQQSIDEAWDQFVSESEAAGE
ncbi:ABC transporter substrate-binding protein [Microbacterium sp.]|uniref:ABC transporter substrate-binding protein n=1 Tax=Microbacterium sp. TaxID=51671 RepID=UPI003562F170